MAAHKGLLEVVKSLLAAGADARVKSSCVISLPHSANECFFFSVAISEMLTV
jgi:hypothetical protein